MSKEAKSKLINRRSAIPWYFPLRIKSAFSGQILKNRCTVKCKIKLQNLKFYFCSATFVAAIFFFHLEAPPTTTMAMTTSTLCKSFLNQNDLLEKPLKCFVVTRLPFSKIDHLFIFVRFSVTWWCYKSGPNYSKRSPKVTAAVWY